MKTLILAGIILAVSGTGAGIPQSAAPQSVEKKAARSSPIAVGETAPDFALGDQNGETLSLSSAVETGPVVLVFYRGYW